MNFTLHRFALPLAHEFTIARGSISVQNSLVIELVQDSVSGFGEATENLYYGHSLDSMSQSINRCKSLLESSTFQSAEDLWQQIQPQLEDDVFALSAIDLAAHDLFGKIAGRHTYEMLGLQWDNIPESSYTIGIDSIDKMVAKLNELPDWKIYKIKLGTDRDVEIVRELRQQTSATFRVDANCGWTAEETIDNSHALKELGVEFIEQPLAANANREEHVQVYEGSALPIIADESCLVEEDVEKCVGRFHGVNVKLCKCGGLTPAARMLRQAKTFGMKTMVGCMVESSVGISAAAQLLPLLDYADLDGAILISKDPADGVSVTNGAVRLSKQFGNGVVLNRMNAEELTLMSND